MWYLKSPPSRRSVTMNKSSSSAIKKWQSTSYSKKVLKRRKYDVKNYLRSRVGSSFKIYSLEPSPVSEVIELSESFKRGNKCKDTKERKENKKKTFHTLRHLSIYLPLAFSRTGKSMQYSIWSVERVHVRTRVHLFSVLRTRFMSAINCNLLET